MSARDPRLAWTLYLVPGPGRDPSPRWPALVTNHFGDVDLGRADPIDRLLHGPWPIRLLARTRTSDTELVLSGLGTGVAITAVAIQRGAAEKGIPTAELRELAVAAIAGEAATAQDLVATLRDDPDWESGGVCEVEAALFEGLPAELPDGPGWRQLGDLRIHRGAGVGAAHVAWHLEAWFSRESVRPTAEQRLKVLTGGFGSLVPSLVQYGWSATRWGLAARDALRARDGVDSVIRAVRRDAAAVVGGDAGNDVDLSALSARLELARTGLREVTEELRSELPALRRAALRVLGDAGRIEAEGPFVEASARGQELVDALLGRDAAAERWAGALSAARELRG